MDEKKPRVDARDTNAPDLGDTAAGPVACNDNTDCAGGEVCRDSWCRTACDGTDDCSAESPVCDLALGFCVMCVDDSHCGPHEACDQRVCNFFCRGNEACEAGSFCDLAAGACLIAECEESEDCGGGFRCEAFRCVPIDPIVCAAATITCVDGGTSVRTCSPDGTSFDDVICDPDFRCVDDADGIAECREIVCAPNELGCRDDQTASLCDHTGTATTALPCLVAQYCQDGICRDRVCLPGSALCEGDAIVTCDALGSQASVTSCMELEACAASAQGCACVEGVCAPRTCIPGSMRCAGNGTQRCTDDGFGYDEIAACGREETCIAGACMSRQCTAGTRECVNDVLVVCNTNGTDRDETDCSTMQQICTGTGVAAACSARICSPGELRCDATESAAIACDSRGANETLTPCANGSECRDGVCLDPCADPSACAPVCEPGSAVCAADGRSIRTCSGDGQVLGEVDCPDGSVCAQGAQAECRSVVCTANSLGCLDADSAWICDATGTVKSPLPCGVDQYCESGSCRDEVCAPGSVVCEGDAVVTCDDLGASATVRSCSQESTCTASSFGCSCVGGECEVRTCAPGSARCAGNSVQRCNADGLAWGALSDCGTSTVCIDGQCVPKTCTPGSRECIGDTLVVCNASGTSRSETDCKATQDICTGTGATAACTDRVCTPNSTVCDATQTAVLVCDGRGAGRSTLQCGTGQYCDGGVCRAQVCEPSSVICDGNAVVTCNTLGSASTIKQCANDPICAGSLYGCSCNGGACLSRTCAPGSTRCAGNSTQTCSSDGLSWAALTSCGDTHVCVGGECRLRVCTAGARECQGDTLVVCNSTGTASTSTNCQTSQKYCSGSGAGSTCTAWACTPDAMTCNVDDTAVLTCDSRGASQSIDYCDAGDVCEAGECVPSCAALGLDGDLTAPDRVIVDFAEYVGLANVTFEIWVKPAALTSYGRIVFAGALQLELSGNGKFLVEAFDATPTPDPGYPIGAGGVWATTAAKLGVWQHLSAQFIGGQLVLHVDGVLQGTANTPFATMPPWDHPNIAWNNTVTAVGDFYRGVDAPGVNEAFHGTVAEFRVSALALYGTGNFTPSRRLEADAGTLLLWHLDEGSGSSTFDASGNGHAGSLEGGVWNSEFCR